MELKPFCFPNPETRLFIMTGNVICKIKLQYGLSIREHWAKLRDNLYIQEELELAIRVTLGNEEELKPFVTDSLSIFPYKHVWEGAGSMKFREHGVDLKSHPFIFILYIEVLNRDTQRTDKNVSGADVCSSTGSESDSIEEQEAQRELKRNKNDEGIGEDDDDSNRSTSTETESSIDGDFHSRRNSKEHHVALAVLPPALRMQRQVAAAANASETSVGNLHGDAETLVGPGRDDVVTAAPVRRSLSRAVLGLFKLPLKLFGY